MPTTLRYNESDSATNHVAQNSLKALLKRTDLGFFQVMERESLWAESEKWGQHLEKNYDHLIIIGIGGSSLGSRVWDDAFGVASKKKIHFCEGVDPVRFNQWINLAQNQASVAWLIISKSGNTIETLSCADFFYQHFGERFVKNSFVVTEKKESPLADWAHKNDRPLIEMPLDVGGRFSVLTAVGLLPARFMGLSLNEIRTGARRALKNEELLTSLISNYLRSFAREEWITQFWIYSEGLKSFGAWTQQLWSESLAKAKSRNAGETPPRVSTPIYQTGPNDQHSVLQQSMEGARDKFCCFLRVKKLESDSRTLAKSHFSSNQIMVGKSLGALLATEAECTEQALRKVGVSTMTIFVDDQSPECIAELFMTLELVVGGLGEAFNINAFDQPGVELGKILTKDSLKAK